MEIKKAKPEDVPIIRQIGTETYWATYPPLLGAEQVQYMLDKFYSVEALQKQFVEGHQFLLFYQQQKPAGFVSFTEMSEDSDTFHLQKIYILPEMQGIGLGRRMVNSVAEICKEAGATRLRLNVNRYNKAKAFYERLGFTVIKEEDIAIGSGFHMNDYIMELHLI